MLCCKALRQIGSDYTLLSRSNDETAKGGPKHGRWSRFQAACGSSSAGREGGVRLHKKTGGHGRATRRLRVLRDGAVGCTGSGRSRGWSARRLPAPARGGGSRGRRTYPPGLNTPSVAAPSRIVTCTPATAISVHRAPLSPGPPASVTLSMVLTLGLISARPRMRVAAKIASLVTTHQ